MCLLKDQTENYSKWVNINRAMNKSHILKAANSEMSSVEPPKPAMDIISVQVYSTTRSPYTIRGPVLPCTGSILTYTGSALFL